LVRARVPAALAHRFAQFAVNGYDAPNGAAGPDEDGG
jgi:hypothetical protein